MMYMDYPNAFIQTNLHLDTSGEKVIMNRRGRLVVWLIETDPFTYTGLVIFENGGNFFRGGPEGNI